MESVHEKIRFFILDNFLHSSADDYIDEDASFIESGVVDSTGILEIVNFIEETFEIKVEDDEVIPDNLDSIKHIVSYIKRKTLKAIDV